MQDAGLKNRNLLLCFGITFLAVVIIFWGRDAVNLVRISELKKKAEQGDFRAQHRLGDVYKYGLNGAERDQVEAVKWYRKAAEQGFVLAQHDLGSAYFSGYGIAQDLTEAVKWYRKAAEQWYGPAQRSLGDCYKDGMGVAQDVTEALIWYRKSADSVEMDYSTTRIIEKIYNNGHAKAVKRLRSAANGKRVKGIGLRSTAKTRPGRAFYQYLLGRAYAFGEGVVEDQAKAVSWYRKAAKRGNALAQFWLGRAYMLGEGIGKDQAKGVRWYRKAAKQGNTQAQFWLGRAYELGEGVAQNSAEAISWYRKASEQGFSMSLSQDALNRFLAELGHAEAQYYSFISMDYGHDRTQKGRAVEWFRKGVELGYVQAQFKLGRAYCLGTGVERDPVEGMNLCRKAADQGDAQAQLFLGYVYEYGVGVKQDQAEAEKWYRKAAELGNVQAQKVLELKGASRIRRLFDSLIL